MRTKLFLLASATTIGATTLLFAAPASAQVLPSLPGGGSIASAQTRFTQGRSPQRAAVYDQALPIITKTTDIMRCIPFHPISDAANEQAWNAVRPYEIDHGNVREDTGSYGTPMAYFHYHDDHGCLAIKSAAVTIPAPNAVSVVVTYLAPDSQETKQFTYGYQRNLEGVWQLAHLGPTQRY